MICLLPATPGGALFDGPPGSRRKAANRGRIRSCRPGPIEGDFSFGFGNGSDILTTDMIEDAELLRAYAEDRSEAAFAELVRRRIGLVYSVAFRQVSGDRHLAEDVVQEVFARTARNAGSLSRHPVPSGWLYRSTRFVAIDFLRADRSRRAREREAQFMHESSANAGAAVGEDRIRPALDQLMAGLSERDRNAIVLRFFEDRPFAEIGRKLKLSEDAARRRVDRALDRMRTVLVRRGLTSTTAMLAEALATQGAMAAPAGLTASATSAALASASAAGTAGVTALVLMSITKLQMGIAVAVLAGITAGLISQHQTIAALRETGADMQQQFGKMAAENAKVQAAANAEIARLNAEIAALKGSVRDTAHAMNSAGRPRLETGQDIGDQTPVADSAALQKKKAQMHSRYDSFLQQRGMTPEQADRFIELKMQSLDMRDDLQSAVREAGLAYGDGSEVEALGSKASQPIVRELHALLGVDGYAAYVVFEKTSYYRAAFVDPMIPMFSSANMPLSQEQGEFLVSVVANNDHPQKLQPTDIGSQSQIDWDSVLAQAKGILSPEQMTIIEAYAGLRKSTK